MSLPHCVELSVDKINITHIVDRLPLPVEAKQTKHFSLIKRHAKTVLGEFDKCFDGEEQNNQVSKFINYLFESLYTLLLRK